MSPWSCSTPPPRFASRAGDKLDAALDRFGIEVAGRRAVDVGASTGGFTDCLLQRGASRVVALDVGHGHLLPRLRDDRRVAAVERCNVAPPGRPPAAPTSAVASSAPRPRS